MKKLLTLTAACAILTAPAMAVQKCVALDSSDTTCTFVQPPMGSADWTSSCTTNNINVQLKGVAECFNSAGSKPFATSDSVSRSDQHPDNYYCWCKMISPAISSWVYLSEEPSSDDCNLYCANNCANYGIINNRDFVSALFSNLSD